MIPATAIDEVVPEDPARPGSDVLRGELEKRTHYVHNAMASGGPLGVNEIGERAKKLAQRAGYGANPKTFNYQTTRNHLGTMKKRGYAERLPDGRWQLTDLAWELIRNPSLVSSAPEKEQSSSEVRTVDDKGRLLLSKEFANATVTVERVGENEIRIRKAVVVPVDELPLIEDQLKPLSDRDRDLFLSLLDNPPEPTAALRKALKLHKKRHG